MAINCDTGQALLTVDEALERLLFDAKVIDQIESVPTLEALGRILAETQRATFDVPEADNSAMDGFAVRAADVQENSPLPISQRIAAGHLGEALQPRTAARIFTGALVPEGADTVVMQEHCNFDDSQVVCQQPVSRGVNIRRRGEDIQQGAVLLQKGLYLRPQDLGLAASMGLAELSVYRRLRVATLFTGDELQNPGEPRLSGKIYNSNRFAVIGLLKRLGCEVIDLGNDPDDPVAIADGLQQAAEQADLIVSSGGVSVGEEDYIRRVLESLGELHLWRIAIKPGKPLAYGKIDSVPFIGLPGNPVSTFITFLLYVRPFILKCQGRNDVHPSMLRAKAGFEKKKPSNRREYLRARIAVVDGEPLLEAYKNQGSGVLSSTSWADGLVCIPEGETVEKGQWLDYLSFSAMF